MLPIAPTQPRRLALWLNLVAALLIALLPAGGMMVCLGHDGHIAMGLASTDGGCPCDHDHDAGNPVHAASSDGMESPDGECQPPCDDLELDAPDACTNAELSPKLAKTLADPVRADSPLFPAGWFPNPSRAESGGVRIRRDVSRGVHRPSLEHRRFVVLLI